jgi:hypothetical protein
VNLVALGETLSKLQDYILGIILIPCVIVGLFLVWLLMTFIFSCCCCGRAGFLSGERFVKSDHGKCCNNARNSRSALLISAGLVVAFSAAFSLKGLVNLESSVEAANKTIQDFQLLVDQGQRASNQLEGNVTQARIDRDNIVASLSVGLSNPLCSSAIEPLITSLMRDTSLDNYTTDYASLAQDAFDSINVNTKEVDTYLGYVKDNETWANYVVPIIFSFITSFFMIGTIVAWRGKSRRCFEIFLTCVLLPLFFILLVLTLILAVLFGLLNVPLSGKNTSLAFNVYLTCRQWIWNLNHK